MQHAFFVPREGLPALSSLGKVQCTQCKRKYHLYCPSCYITTPTFQSYMPVLTLPVQIGIVLHEKMERKKSTALHTLLLCPQQVTVYTFPNLPHFDPTTTLLVYPSSHAGSIQQISRQREERERGGESGDKRNAIRLVLFLEASWDDASLMSHHPKLTNLPCVTLSHDASNSESSRHVQPSTVFWRFQPFGSHFLSSIEAIHQFFVQSYPYQSQLFNNDINTQIVSVDYYTNLLYLFRRAHQHFIDYYTQHAELLPPVGHQHGHAYGHDMSVEKL